MRRKRAKEAVAAAQTMNIQTPAPSVFAVPSEEATATRCKRKHFLRLGDLAMLTQDDCVIGVTMRATRTTRTA
jgi:hypothetical protein